MQKVITFGEIMLRLATPGYKRFIQSDNLTATFGGGEANVAVSLANYGIPVEFVTRLPENEIAEWCLSELRKYNVGTRQIVRGGERVGIYFLETGAVARPSKVVYDRAYSSIAEVEKGMFNWKEILKDASWFHWTGITPALSQGAADTCLEAINTANEMGITVSCDLNYRKNLWKYGKKPRTLCPSWLRAARLFWAMKKMPKKYSASSRKGFRWNIQEERWMPGSLSRFADN
jgi:Sugar kinases, ribokinase family